MIISFTITKVFSECFAERLGKPCCKKTGNILSIDNVGKWGFEDGHLKKIHLIKSVLFTSIGE